MRIKDDHVPKVRTTGAAPVASKKTTPPERARAVGTRSGRPDHQRPTNDRVGGLFPSEKLVGYWYPAVE